MPSSLETEVVEAHPTTPLRRVRRALIIAITIALCAAAPLSASAQDCTGDCSANRTVTIDELVRCVSIALGTIAVDVCPACDSDGNGVVAIQELIQSVRAALGQAILESNGRCLEPGPTGLQPCAQGTSVRVTRCDELAICLSTGGGDGLPAGTLDADGRFTDNLDSCQVVSSAVLFSAQIDDTTTYRVMDFGPIGHDSAATVLGVSGGPLTDVELSPASEAAVRLAEEDDRAACTPGQILAIRNTVSIANAATVFSGLSPAAAIDAALVAARGNAAVQDALRCGAPAPTDTPNQPATPTASFTVSVTATRTGTATNTPTSSNTPTATRTATPSSTPTPPPSVDLDVQINPDPVQPGETMTMLVTATNTGSTALAQVEVEVQLPQSIANFGVNLTTGAPATCIGDTFTATCSPGERVVWTVGTLNPGASVVLGLPPSVVSGAGAPADGTELSFTTRVRVAQVNFSFVEHTVTVMSERLLDLALDEDHDPVAPGDALTYRVSFGNASAATLAQGVTLRVPVPVGTTMTEVSDGGTVTGGVAEWSLGTLSPGQTGTRQLKVLVGQDVADGAVVLAEASIEDSGGKRTQVGNATRVESGVPLHLTLELNPDPAEHGDTVTGLLTVTNTGAVDLLEVEAQVQLPDAAANFGTNVTSGATATCVGDTFVNTCSARERLVWTIGTVAAGTGVVLNMPPAIADMVAVGRVVTFNARVESGNGFLATTGASLRVETARLLDLALAEDHDPVAPGEALTYQLSFGNPNAATLAQGVTLRMPVPVGMTVVDASDGGTVTNGVVEWTLGTISPAQTGTRTVHMQAGAALIDGAVVRAEATLDDSGGRRTRATTETRVQGDVPLHLTLELNPDPAEQEETVNGQLTVSNTGLVDLLSVEVEVALPEAIANFGTNVTSGATATCVGDTFVNTCSARERLVWTVGAVAPGTGVVLSMPPGVAAAATIGQVASFNARARTGNGFLAAARSGLRVENTRLLDLALDEDHDPVAPGDALTYRVSFGNPTAALAQGVTLRVPVPVGTTMTEVSDGGTVTGGVAEWSLGTLSPGQTGTRQLKVLVGQDVADGAVVLAEASIEDSGGKRTQVGNATRVESGVPLHLTLELNPDPAEHGDTVTGLLTVTNTGAVDLLEVEAQVQLPDAAANFGTNVTSGATATCVGDTFVNTCSARERLVWTIGTVAAGTGVVLNMPPAIADMVAVGRVVTFNARVESGNGFLATAGASLRVETARLLDLVLAEDHDPVAPGEALTYQLSFGNPNAATLAQGVTLRMPVPVGMTVVDASDGGTVTNGVVEWALGTISPAQTGTRTVHMEADGALIDGAVVRAEATLDDSGGRRTRATTETRVQGDVPLHLTLEVGPDPAPPAQILSGTLTVSNTGPVDLLTVEVEVTLPESIANFGTNLTSGATATCFGDTFVNTCSARERLVWTVGTINPNAMAVLSMPPPLNNTIAKGSVVPFNARARATGGLQAAARVGVRVAQP